MEQLAKLYDFYDSWGIVNALAALIGFLVFWLTRFEKTRRETKAKNVPFYSSNFFLDEWISFLISGLLTLIGCPALHEIQKLGALMYLIIGWSGGSIFKYVYEKVIANLENIPFFKSSRSK